MKTSIYKVILASLGIFIGLTVQAQHPGNDGFGIWNGSSNSSTENIYRVGSVGIGLNSENLAAKLHVIGNTILNGNVGIGTNNPLAKLHINGDLRGGLGAGMLRLRTDYGHIDIGSYDTTWSRFQTDRPRYYFNREIWIEGGKFSSLNNDLTLMTHGTSRMTVKRNSGNVGIGTSNPDAKLTVAGDVNIGGSGQGILKVRHVDGKNYQNANNDHLFLNYNTGKSVYVGHTGNHANLLVSGKTGIGTSNPHHLLDLGATLGKKLAVYQNSSGNDFYGLGISGYTLELHSNSQANDAPDMVIKSDGKIGVGMTQPEFRMDIYGRTTNMLRMGVNDGNDLTFDVASGTGLANIVGGAKKLSSSAYHYTGTRGASRIQLHDGMLRFYTSNSITGTTNQEVTWSLGVVQDKDGKVGIGTEMMGSHKLAVEGSIGAREVLVETGEWSDFVFAEDYELMPLKELRKYIQKNHHLPEIPSEAEVIANGVELGKMNQLLLQKIEELTLYILAQEERIERLEKGSKE